MADIKSTAREYLESWNRRDFDAMRACLHPQYSYTGGDGKRQQGLDAGIAVARMFADGFPDGRLEIRGVQNCGDNLAVVEFTGQGTHRGELMGIAPTGRQMSIPVCVVLEFREGKIYAEREYMDMLHIMVQLGVAAPMGAQA